MQNLGSPVPNRLLDGYGREAGVGRGHGVGAHLAVHGVEVGVGIGVIVDVGVLVGVAVEVGVGVGFGVMVGIGVGVAVGVTVGVRVGVPPAGATTRLSTTKMVSVAVPRPTPLGAIHICLVRPVPVKNTFVPATALGLEEIALKVKSLGLVESTSVKVTVTFVASTPCTVVTLLVAREIDGG